MLILQFSKEVLGRNLGEDGHGQPPDGNDWFNDYMEKKDGEDLDASGEPNPGGNLEKGNMF